MSIAATSALKIEAFAHRLGKVLLVRAGSAIKDFHGIHHLEDRTLSGSFHCQGVGGEGRGTRAYLSSKGVGSDHHAASFFYHLFKFLSFPHIYNRTVKAENQYFAQVSGYLYAAYDQEVMLLVQRLYGSPVPRLIVFGYANAI
jgi:hypothetical protein